MTAGRQESSIVILSINFHLMRTTAIVTISLPPIMLKASERAAKRQQMTRSEFLRTAVRRYLEELSLAEALRVSDMELELGQAKALPRGGLRALIR